MVIIWYEDGRHYYHYHISYLPYFKRCGKETMCLKINSLCRPNLAISCIRISTPAYLEFTVWLQQTSGRTTLTRLAMSARVQKERKLARYRARDKGRKRVASNRPMWCGTSTSPVWMMLQTKKLGRDALDIYQKALIMFIHAYSTSTQFVPGKSSQN